MGTDFSEEELWGLPPRMTKNGRVKLNEKNIMKTVIRLVEDSEYRLKEFLDTFGSLKKIVHSRTSVKRRKKCKNTVTFEVTSAEIDHEEEKDDEEEKDNEDEIDNEAAIDYEEVKDNEEEKDDEEEKDNEDEIDNEAAIDYEEVKDHEEEKDQEEEKEGKDHGEVKYPTNDANKKPEILRKVWVANKKPEMLRKLRAASKKPERLEKLKDAKEKPEILDVLTDADRKPEMFVTPKVCKKCGVKRKTPVSYLRHILSCGKSDSVKVACQMCSKMLLPSSFEKHRCAEHALTSNRVAAHRASLQTQYVMKQEKKRNTSSPASPGMVLSPGDVFTCNMCGTSRKSASGYYSHILRCGKSPKEVGELRQPCPICGRRLMASSLYVHMYKVHKNVQNL